MKTRKKYYAFVEHAIIEAIAYTLFRFKTIEQAEAIARRVSEEFILAKRSFPGEHKLALWVRSYGVTQEELKKGFTGHYTKLFVQPFANDKWTLSFEKIDVPLRQHPERKIVDRRHPNWGHPVMRTIYKKKTYASKQAAQEQLDKLHEDFPNVSIPGLGKLKILVYRKPENGKPAMLRLELFVRRHGENEYLIDFKETGSARTTPTERLKTQVKAKAHVAQGRFTALVAKRRKRKSA